MARTRSVSKSDSHKEESPRKKRNLEDHLSEIPVPPDLALPQEFIDFHHPGFIDGIRAILAKDPSLYPAIVHRNFVVFSKSDPDSRPDSEIINDYWYKLVSAVIGQQISGSAAKAIETRFRALFDSVPTPQDLLTKDHETLRAVGLLNQKLAYVLHISTSFTDPTLPLTSASFYRNSTSAELITELTKLKGIGEWSAKMFLVFTLKELDVFAYDDLGVARGVSRYLANRPQLLAEVKQGVHAVEALKLGLKKKGKFMKSSSKRDWIPLHDEYVKLLGAMHAPYQLVFMLIMWRLLATNVEILENVR